LEFRTAFLPLTAIRLAGYHPHAHSPDRLFEQTVQQYHNHVSTVKDGGRWYEVLPCPQPKAVAMTKSNEPKNRELEPRGKLLVAELKDPLRAEIISLAREDTGSTPCRNTPQLLARNYGREIHRGHAGAPTNEG
jgi:hypothetical protein